MAGAFNFGEAYRFATPINADPAFQQGMNRLADAFTWTPEKMAALGQAQVAQQQSKLLNAQAGMAQAKWDMMAPILRQGISEMQGGAPAAPPPDPSAGPSPTDAQAGPQGAPAPSNLGQMFGGAPQQAPRPQPVGGPPAMGGAPGGGGAFGLPQGANMRQLLGLDAFFPGAANTVIGKLMEPTDLQRAMNAAGIDPRSPTGQAMATSGALKLSGMPDSVRPGGLWRNPITGQMQVAPNVAANMQPIMDPFGNMIRVQAAPGATGAEFDLARAKEGGQGMAIPQEVATAGGGKTVLPRTQVLDPGAIPGGQAAPNGFPGAQPQPGGAPAGMPGPVNPNLRPVNVPQNIYSQMAGLAEQQYGLPPGLLARSLTAESGLNPSSPDSSAGAQGIAQFMPKTAAGLNVDPRNPLQAVDGSAKMLKGLLDHYNGDQGLAIAAYNWGSGNVDNWLHSGADPNAMPAETRNHLFRVFGGQQPDQAAGSAAGGLQAPQQGAAAPMPTANAIATTPGGQPLTALPPQVIEAYKHDADRLQEYNKDADPAEVQRVGLTINELRNILKTYRPGAGANAFQSLANVAQRMGVQVPQGMNPNDASAFQKLSSDLVAQVVKAYGGQPRVVEFATAERSNPSLSLPLEANLRILNHLDAVNQYRPALAGAASQYFQQNGHLGMGQFETDFNKQHGLDGIYNDIMSIYGAAGAKPVSQVGAPGAAPMAQPGSASQAGNDIYSSAAAAIQRGAPRDAVLKRLQQMGADPTKLGGL